MPWMVIYPLGADFSYEPDAAEYKGGAWIIHNLIDSVAKGGNFMVGIGPDATGRFHPTQSSASRRPAHGSVNGEGIYATRPARGQLWKKGDAIRFTRSKDSAASSTPTPLQWPGAELKLATVRPAAGATVTMLGLEQPLTWTPEGDGVSIRLPEAFADPARRLGTHGVGLPHPDGALTRAGR